MVRVEFSSPPGVSIWMIRARAPLDFARAKLSGMKSSTAGLMLPSMEIRSTGAVAASFDWASTETPAASKKIRPRTLSVFTAHLFDDFLDIFPDELLSAGLRSRYAG